MTGELPSAVVEALFIVAIIGGIAGLIGGFLGSKHNLIGAVLLGIIGGLSAAAVARIAGAEPLMSVGEGFSAVYAGIGGLVLGYAVGRSTA